LQSGNVDAGENINRIGHLSSNTKIAALAFIAKLRGVDYIRANEAPLKKMMSLSHNDATIVEVARAMNYPDATKFRAGLRPLSVSSDGTIDRKNDNVMAKSYPEETRRFFETYRAEIAKHATEFGIEGAKFNEPSGRAERGLAHGTSQASPLHIAHLVGYLYKLDNGKTLKALGDPNSGPHTTSKYLGDRAGQVFFAKTGTVAKSDYDKLPAGSDVPQRFPNGVYVLTMGYMEQGKPKMVFLRANSSQERKDLANAFLDNVASQSPQHVAARKPRPTNPSA
jgi:hypothetical protein